MVSVIGIDLSLTATGVASNEGWCHVAGIDGITTMALRDRVAKLRWLAAKITAGVPDTTTLVAIEQPAFSRAYGGAVERHALWYTVVADLIARGIPVAEIGATSLKKYATGKGSAGKGGSTKSAMVDALARRMPQFETRGNDNLVDAAWLAAMGADHLGVPIVAMPAAHRAALSGVTWPTTPHLTEESTMPTPMPMPTPSNPKPSPRPRPTGVVA